MTANDSLQRKSLENWILETEDTARIAYEKYVDSINDLSCPYSVQAAYSDIAVANSSLRDTLHHIKIYGGIYCPHKCSACRANDVNHCKRIQSTYDKYKKWILQCRG